MVYANSTKSCFKWRTIANGPPITMTVGTGNIQNQKLERTHQTHIAHKYVVYVGVLNVFTDMLQL